MRHHENNVESYYEWLISFTIDDQYDSDDYDILFHKLWSIPFHGAIGNDENRARDGLNLRKTYDNNVAEHIGVNGDAAEYAADIYGPCRVLEMLVALSMHMYDAVKDLGLDNSVSRWFWEILEQSGLDIYDNDNWSDLNGNEEVADIVHNIMDLKDNGISKKGGWFNLREWKDYEIWYQMHIYLKRYLGFLRR